MPFISTREARAELERSLLPSDPRRAALSALPDEIEIEAFDAAFPLLLRLLHQRPADGRPP
jgi:hypothetical protein